MPIRVLVSTSSFGRSGRQPLELLERAGCEVSLNPHGRTLTADEARALLADCDGVVAGTEKLTREVLAAVPRLKVVSRCGTGLDSVDLAAARELGIRVRNTPDAHVDGVAELTLAGILGVLRHVAAADAAVRAGAWKKPMGRLLRGRTVGIVGLGRVGRALVALLQPFAVTVLACDPVEDGAFAASRAVSYVPLGTLLERTDVVCVHAPGGAGPVVDAAAIARMKRGAIVVNTARGGLVDEEALAAALADGRLGGAYLDVFAREPYQGPLTAAPNVVLTPHIGAYAEECRLRMETEAAENLLRGLREAGVLP
jgi:D-3-phosphoglycerate dehydrogenase